MTLPLSLALATLLTSPWLALAQQTSTGSGAAPPRPVERTPGGRLPKLIRLTVIAPSNCTPYQRRLVESDILLANQIFRRAGIEFKLLDFRRVLNSDLDAVGRAEKDRLMSIARNEVVKPVSRAITVFLINENRVRPGEPGFSEHVHVPQGSSFGMVFVSKNAEADTLAHEFAEVLLDYDPRHEGLRQPRDKNNLLCHLQRRNIVQTATQVGLVGKLTDEQIDAMLNSPLLRP